MTRRCRAVAIGMVRMKQQIEGRRERQLVEAEIERLEHVRPSAEPTIQRAIDDRIVTLKRRLENL